MKIFVICADVVFIMNENSSYVAPYGDFLDHCEQLDLTPAAPLSAGYKVLSISNAPGRSSFIEDHRGARLPIKDIVSDISVYIALINNIDQLNKAREAKLVTDRPPTPVSFDVTDRIA